MPLFPAGPSRILLCSAHISHCEAYSRQPRFFPVTTTKCSRCSARSFLLVVAVVLQPQLPDSLAYLTASPLGSWVDLRGTCASLGGQSSLALLAASQRRAFGRHVDLPLLAAQGRSFGRVAWTVLRRGPCLGAPASSRKKPLCLARTHWNSRQTIAWIGTHRNRHFRPCKKVYGSSVRPRVAGLRSEPISAG
ncbi:hypothetical protein ABIB68_008134 [Bradyrhizobium sp. F1.2.2]